jgi:hypothetical protein
VDSYGLCYVASLRRATSLLGLDNFLPDVLLENVFRKHCGLTWQDCTKLIQACNSLQKRVRSPGLTFGGKASKVNLIRSTVSGPLEFTKLPMAPGVYLCGAAAAAAGHMLVTRWVSPTDMRVVDSADGSRNHRQYDPEDCHWVTGWTFLRQCFPGHF